MNPDRNVQFSVASLDELRSTTSPVRRLFVVPAWKEGDRLHSKSAASASEVPVHKFACCFLNLLVQQSCNSCTMHFYLMTGL